MHLSAPSEFLLSKPSPLLQFTFNISLNLFGGGPLGCSLQKKYLLSWNSEPLLAFLIYGRSVKDRWRKGKAKRVRVFPWTPHGTLTLSPVWHLPCFIVIYLFRCLIPPVSLGPPGRQTFLFYIPSLEYPPRARTYAEKQTYRHLDRPGFPQATQCCEARVGAKLGHLDHICCS